MRAPAVFEPALEPVQGVEGIQRSEILDIDLREFFEDVLIRGGVKEGHLGQIHIVVVDRF
jgi:hypothetical protein